MSDDIFAYSDCFVMVGLEYDDVFFRAADVRSQFIFAVGHSQFMQIKTLATAITLYFEFERCWLSKLIRFIFNGVLNNQLAPTWNFG